MSYACDVFVSYRNYGLMGAWVRGTLVHLLREALHEEGLPEPRVFVDSDLPDGARWPKALQEAHAGAKVFLLVLSAAYWTRPWCVHEALGAFAQADGSAAHPVVFIARFNDLERDERARDQLNGLHDGLFDQVHGLQHRDFGGYTHLQFEFHRALAPFPELHREVRELARHMMPSLREPRPVASLRRTLPDRVEPAAPAPFAAHFGGAR